MPPSMKLNLGPPLNTRATNKTAHPGDILKSSQRRSHAEVEEERQEKAWKQKESVDAEKKGLQAIADTEDSLRFEDENCKHTHIQAARSNPGKNPGNIGST